MTRLTLLKKHSCHDCRVLSQELAFLGLSSTVISQDIEQDAKARELLLAGGKSRVPCLLVEKNGAEGGCEKQWIYGLDEITQYLRTM